MPKADLNEIVSLAAEAAADKKAFQIVAFEVTELTSYADYLMICSGGSKRQVEAIADAILRHLRDNGHRPLHPHGDLGGEWILLDFGDVVLHVFTEEKRLYYGLDNLWGDAPRIAAEDLGLHGSSTSSTS